MYKISSDKSFHEERLLHFFLNIFIFLLNSFAVKISYYPEIPDGIIPQEDVFPEA
jgi:uncharacterized membrane protein